MSIKAGWQDTSLALWDFSQSNKHYIPLSTTKTLYFCRFVFVISAFSPIEIFYYTMLQITSWSTNMFSFFVMAVSFQSRFPILICNKSAAEVWICLISEVVTGVFYKKRHSQIFWKFHRKTLVLESLFDKAF